MNDINNLWNNGKIRGIIFLVFYVILFGYIFIVYGTKSEKIILPESKPFKQEKKSYDSYEYDYIFEENTYHVTKYNDIVYFKINDQDFYSIDNKIYLLNDEKLKETENPLKYNFDYLNNFDQIKNISSLVKTTKYASGKSEDNYNISLAGLLNIFGITEEVDAKEITNYTIFISDDEISEITFNDLKVTIKYTKFKDISEININYDFYSESEV